MYLYLSRDLHRDLDLVRSSYDSQSAISGVHGHLNEAVGILSRKVVGDSIREVPLRNQHSVHPQADHPLCFTTQNVTDCVKFWSRECDQHFYKRKTHTFATEQVNVTDIIVACKRMTHPFHVLRALLQAIVVCCPSVVRPYS